MQTRVLKKGYRLALLKLSHIRQKVSCFRESAEILSKTTKHSQVSTLILAKS